jgi:UrcA family protein
MEWRRPIGDSRPRKEGPPFAPGTGGAERGPEPTRSRETAMYRFTTTMMIFAMVLGFQSAHAAPPQAVPSVVVHFADLDLSRSAGATMLYQRLKGAAETVCAPLDDRDLARHMSFKACVQSAISTAVAKVDRPALTAYYEAKTNDRNATIQIAQK